MSDDWPRGWSRDPWWIRYGRETSRLSFAPEFGNDRSWPPVSTPWLALRWELFEATPNEASTSRALSLLRSFDLELREDERDALSPNFVDRLFGQAHRGPGHLGRAPLRRRKLPSRRYEPTSDPKAVCYLKEVRRLVHYVRWRRNDPVTQLPPDAVQENSYSVTTGLSMEHSQTLAKSLGAELGTARVGVHATLTRQLQQQFRLKLEITEQEQRTSKLTLTNQSRGYRLFALWRVEHLITVDALAAELARQGYRHSWLPRANVEFVANTDPVVTYTDIAPSRR